MYIMIKGKEEICKISQRNKNMHFILEKKMMRKMVDFSSEITQARRHLSSKY